MRMVQSDGSQKRSRRSSRQAISNCATHPPIASPSSLLNRPRPMTVVSLLDHDDIEEDDSDIGLRSAEALPG